MGRTVKQIAIVFSTSFYLVEIGVKFFPSPIFHPKICHAFNSDLIRCRCLPMPMQKIFRYFF